MKYKFNKEYEINKESVDKMAAIKGIDTSKGGAVTDVLDLDLGTSLIDFIWEAEKEAIKNDIRANTVMISKKLVKVNGFEHFFGNGYADFPPLICGLEAYVTDELPEEFAFGLVEAPCTQREHHYKEAYDLGYKNAMRDIKEMPLDQIVKMLEEQT